MKVDCRLAISSGGYGRKDKVVQVVAVVAGADVDVDVARSSLEMKDASAGDLSEVAYRISRTRRRRSGQMATN
jgi:hypothetical protein